MFDISRSPQLIFEDHAGPGASIVYTNLTSCQIVCTGVVMGINGAPGDQGQMWINGSLVYYVVIATGDAFASAAFSAEIVLGPTDAIKMTSASAIGTLGFAVSGWLYNPNG